MWWVCVCSRWTLASEEICRRELNTVVYYESIKREPKIRGIYECRCEKSIRMRSLNTVTPGCFFLWGTALEYHQRQQQHVECWSCCLLFASFLKLGLQILEVFYHIARCPRETWPSRFRFSISFSLKLGLGTASVKEWYQLCRNRFQIANSGVTLPAKAEVTLVPRFASPRRSFFGKVTKSLLSI